MRRRPVLARTLTVAAAVAGAALVVLGAPAGALGQSGAPTLREARDSGFPEKVFQLGMPGRRAVTAGSVSLSENGTPVSDLSVEAPGAANGVVLLIDASNSMQGAPIQGAMQAARAFLAQRSPKVPVAVVVFGPDDTVLTNFTKSREELAPAVASAPPRA